MPSSARVVVAGGGPAAVESLLALRALGGDQLGLALVSPDKELVVRAYEVLSPFREGHEHRYPLARVAADLGVELIRDAVESVDPDSRRLSLRSGAETGYDALVIAVGARSLGTIAGAVVFHGAKDASRVKELLIESRAGRHRSVAFIVPGGHTWPLPLYELALHTSAWLSERSVFGVPLTLVSPEPQPLAAFGASASREVTELLREHRIQFLSGRAVRHEGGRLLLAGGGDLDADLAIGLPRLGGPAVHGLPHDHDGFLPVDDSGRVTGVNGVFAAGDATNFPIKQGGLATQQADVVAAVLAAELGGAPPSVRQAPMLRAVLYGGRDTRYLQAELGDQLDVTSQVSRDPLWPESSKLVGRYLAAYLDSLDEVRVAR